MLLPGVADVPGLMPRSMAPRIRAAALLVMSLPVLGCTYVTGSLPPCPSVHRSPTKLTFQISGMPYYSRAVRAEVRHSLYFRLTEPNGIALWVFRPQLRQVDCVRIPDEEVEVWTTNAESLLHEPGGFELLDPADVPDDELLIVGYHHSQVAIELSDLTQDGLDATRTLACRAASAFGKRFETAFEEITPALAARIGFPVSCADLENPGRPADETG